MDAWKALLWQQLGAAIDTLGNAIEACPDSLWDDGSKPPELFWYAAYHCLFFLDYYVSEREESFAPPAPFTMSEADPSGALPGRTYTKDELRAYLEHGRRKCRERIASLSERDAGRPCDFARPGITAVGILLYTMRHVQHHASQLNLLLRQKTGSAPPWVSKARDPLELARRA
jgi:hypothetical protein